MLEAGVSRGGVCSFTSSTEKRNTALYIAQIIQTLWLECNSDKEAGGRKIRGESCPVHRKRLNLAKPTKKTQTKLLTYLFLVTLYTLVTRRVQTTHAFCPRFAPLSSSRQDLTGHPSLLIGVCQLTSRTKDWSYTHSAICSHLTTQVARGDSFHAVVRVKSRTRHETKR